MSTSYNDLTEEQREEIKGKLLVIIDEFVSDPLYQPVWDTQYVTATYNRENPELPIDGVTVEMLLNGTETEIEEIPAE